MSPAIEYIYDQRLFNGLMLGAELRFMISRRRYYSPLKLNKRSVTVLVV